MYTLVRNLLLVVSLVAVAFVLVRAAQHGDGTTLPAAAIKGGRDPQRESKKDNELPPRVLQVNPRTGERGGVSPVAPLEGSRYELLPAARPMSPVPSPTLQGATGKEDPQPRDAAHAEYPLSSALALPEAPPQRFSSESGTAEIAAEGPAAGLGVARVTTGPDDSFWSISQKAYGSSAYYRALFRHNRAEVLRPDQLRAGIEIEVPPLETLRLLYPQDCPADDDAG